MATWDYTGRSSGGWNWAVAHTHTYIHTQTHTHTHHFYNPVNIYFNMFIKAIVGRVLKGVQEASRGTSVCLTPWGSVVFPECIAPLWALCNSRFLIGSEDELAVRKALRAWTASFCLDRLYSLPVSLVGTGAYPSMHWVGDKQKLWTGRTTGGNRNTGQNKYFV